MYNAGDVDLLTQLLQVWKLETMLTSSLTVILWNKGKGGGEGKEWGSYG